ncbi:MAG TPA: Dickkopf N-terminal cysteine-rich domain-containing protein, partial [Polyangia bacterium]|nr:Dickkopf N-terminal cysteine-rich domain-containing protein [Polyangia bacterium]
MVAWSNRALTATALCLVALGGCDGTLPAASADGAAVSGAIRVPAVHRAAGTVCPAARGVGTICGGGADGGADACLADGDCAAGANGRCVSPEGPAPICGPAACSYDQCAADRDCPARVPCVCRPSAASPAANVCVSGGNCAVDADCGPGGYCSPGGFADFCATPVYFCHTRADTCTDDADCGRGAAGVRQACTYDP